MTTVRFTDLPDGEWVRVAFAYNPIMIAIVKELSPGLRRYDPQSKSWSVFGELAVQLAEEMTRAGATVVHGDEPVPVEPARDRTVGSFFGIDDADGYDPKAAAAEIIATLPGQHVGKVFRAMGRQLYPDLYPAKAGR